MWATILSLLNAALGAFNKWLDRQAAEDLKKLGALEQEQKHIDEQRRNEQIASEVDARPVDRDKHRVVGGLRKPPGPDA